MNDRLVLSMRNTTKDMVRVLGEASAFLESLSVPPEVLYKANLVLEEILTNIVKYAFVEGGHHDVGLHLARQGHELIIRFADKGCEFNPLACPAPSEHDSLLDCPVGGLGIHLVCKTADRLDYVREQGTNILTIGLKLPGGSGSCGEAVE